ncbi:hypothetical protein, partial [Kaarinaea lacus]
MHLTCRNWSFRTSFSGWSFDFLLRLSLTATCLSGLIHTPLVLAFDYFQPLPEQAMVPADNPLTAAKIALGKQL